MADIVAARVATTRSFDPGTDRNKHELIVLWSNPDQTGELLDWKGVLERVTNFYDTETVFVGGSAMKGVVASDPLKTKNQWEAQCHVVNRVRWVHKDNKDELYLRALARADVLLQQFNPYQSDSYYDIQKIMCANTHELSGSTPIVYKMRIITGSGGFTDAVNTGALLTTGALETRQKEANRRAGDVWEAYSDLLMALFDRLRQATNNAIEATAFDLDPIPNNTFLNILKYNPIETTSANDALAKKCIAHFHDSETMRSAGRLVAGNWSAPSQWMTTARLAQSGINVDPDNIPTWEHTLHHASVEEHLEELGSVLALTEAILFSKDSMIQCTKSEEITIKDTARYRPISHLSGAGSGAWLWHSLTSAAQGKNALERLERAHTSTLPFGVPFQDCRYADAVFHIVKCALHNTKPLLALGDPTAEPTRAAPTVSFRSNYVGGTTNTLNTWGVGVASTAIEEALQLAVATLYLFDWKHDPNPEKASGLANYAQITALLKAPLLQGVNATVEPRGKPLVPFQDTIPIFDDNPKIDDPKLQRVFQHIKTLTDAVEWPNSTIVIKLELDSMFYDKADPGWSPDQKYQVNYEVPTEFNEPSAVTSNTAFEELIQRFALGFDEVVVDREMIQVSSPSDSKLRPWKATLQFKMNKAADNYERLRNNILNAYRFVYQRHRRVKPLNGHWDDPTTYTATPGSWGTLKHIAPEYNDDYESMEAGKTGKSRVEKATIVSFDDNSILIEFENDKLQYEFVQESYKFILLRLPDVEMLYDDELLEETGVPWKLTYDMLKENVNNLVVYASRQDGTSKDKLEAIRAKEQLEESAMSKRIKLDAKETFSLAMPNTSTVKLIDIKPDRRVGLQIYYSTTEEGSQKQYAGVAVERNKDGKYHIVWEDGLEGDLLADNLLITDDRITHPFYLNKSVMSYTWKNISEVARGDVTLADLTFNRYRQDLSNVLTTRQNVNGDTDYQLVSGVTKFDPNEKDLYFYITVDEKYRVQNPEAFVLRIGMIQRGIEMAGIFGRPIVNVEWKMLKEEDLKGKAVGIKESKILKWKKVDNVTEERVIIDGKGYGDVTLVPNMLLPVRSVRTVTITVFDTKPEVNKFAVNPGDDPDLNEGSMNPGEIVRQAMKGGGKKESKDKKKSRLLTWDVHVEMPSNKFKPTAYDKMLLKNTIGGFESKIKYPTLTFLFNDDMQEVSLKNLSGVAFTETVRAFYDFDDDTHIRVKMFGHNHAIKLHTTTQDTTTFEGVKSAFAEFTNNTLAAMQQLPSSPSWEKIKTEFTPANLLQLEDFWGFYFVFKNGDGYTPIDKNKLFGYFDKDNYKKSHIYKFLKDPFKWHINTKPPQKIGVSINGVHEERMIYCFKYKGTESTFNEPRALKWFAQQLFKEKGYVNGFSDTMDKSLIFVKAEVKSAPETPKFKQLYVSGDVNDDLIDDESYLIQSGTLGYEMNINVAKRQLIVLVAGRKDSITEFIESEKSRPTFADPTRFTETVDYEPVFMNSTGRQNIQNRVALKLHQIFEASGINLDSDYQGLRIVGGNEAMPVQMLHRVYVYDDAINMSSKKNAVIKPGSRYKLKPQHWVRYNMLEAVIKQNGLAPVLIYIDASNPYEDDQPYRWEQKFLTSQTWTAIDQAKQKNILEAFNTHQRKETGETWPTNAEGFLKKFKDSTSADARIFIAKKALTQNEYEDIMLNAPEKHKAKMVLLDWRNNKYWVKRKYEEGGIDGYQNNFRYPRSFRLPQESRSLKILNLPSNEIAPNGDVDSGNEETKGGAKTSKQTKTRRNASRRKNVSDGDNDDDDENFNPEDDDDEDFNPEDDDTDDDNFNFEDTPESTDAMFAEDNRVTASGLSKYGRWRSQMEYNARMALYFADPLAGDTLIDISIIPRRYTIRANASKTLTEIAERLAGDKVLRVSDFPHEHVESSDGKLCWSVTADGHIDPIPQGAKPITVYEATADLDKVHATVADAFGGWHYARATESRQTAHALLCGRSQKVIENHITELKRSRPHFVIGRNNSTVYDFLDLLQSMSATLVDDLVIMVKGPGRNAVATPCKVPAIKHFTTVGDKVASEMADRIVGVLKQLPRNVPTTSLAYAWRQRGRIPLNRLVETTELHHNLARVFAEMHLCDTVRADAGKRYHHSLPVKAGQLALRNALHDLLVCSWP